MAAAVPTAATAATAAIETLACFFFVFVLAKTFALTHFQSAREAKAATRTTAAAAAALQFTIAPTSVCVWVVGLRPGQQQ